MESSFWHPKQLWKSLELIFLSSYLVRASQVKVETTGQRDLVYFGFIFVSVCSLLHSNWKENKLKRKIPSLLPPSEPQYENLVSTADSLS